MKVYIGLIIVITLVISIIAAIFGTGLFIVGHQVQNPKTAEFVRQELEEISLLDMLGGKTSSQPTTKPWDEEEIVIPAHRKGDKLYVEVELNDEQVVELLVDTGATDIALESVIAYDLGYSNDEAKELTYNTARGPRQQFVITLDTVRIGEAVQSNVRGSFGYGFQNKFKDGLLGMSFLKHYYVDIDLNRQELHLRLREN